MAGWYPRPGTAVIRANGWPSGQRPVKNPSRSMSWSGKSSADSASGERRSAVAVAWSVPGARPMPRSMRPGCSASSMPNCSATTSETWFGSITPPEPTRMVVVASAMWPISTGGAELAMPGMLWCSATQNRRNPSRSACRARSMVARSASPAFPPSGTGARSRTESGTDSGPKVRAEPGSMSSTPFRTARAARFFRGWSGLAADGAPHLGPGGGIADRGGAPFGDADQAGLEQVEPGEEAGDLAVGPRHALLGHQLVEPVGHADHRAVVDVARRMADHHVAARRHGVDQLADQVVRVIPVQDEVQDGDQHDRHRAAEVQRPRGFGQDLLRLTQVGLDVVGDTFRGAGEQRPGVRRDDRVVIDVDDAGSGRDGLGHLVNVVVGRHAGADVEELADAGLADQVTRGADAEGSVGPGGGDDVRVDPHGLLGGLAVRGEIVLAAQQVVVDPRDMRNAGVARQRPLRTRSGTARRLRRHESSMPRLCLSYGDTGQRRRRCLILM